MQEPASRDEERALSEWLASDGALTPDDALEVVIPLAAVITALHAAGSVDGSLSPSRVLVRRGGDGAVIVRLGPTPDGDSARRARQAAFTSPEQARGRAPDDRSDQFALGAILGHCLRGPRETQPGAPDGTALARLVERATHADPSRRFSSVRAFGDALAELAPADVRERWLPEFDRPSVVSPRRRDDSTGRTERPRAIESQTRRGGGTVLGAILVFVVIAVAFVVLASIWGR